MTKREVGTLVFKLAALSLFALGLTSFPVISGPASLRVAPLVLLGAAVLVWFGADRLSRRLFEEDAVAVQVERGAIAQVASLAFSVVGLWTLLVHVIPGLFDYVASIVSVSKVTSGAYVHQAVIHLRVELVGTLLQLALGLGLLLRPSWILRFVQFDEEAEATTRADEM